MVSGATAIQVGTATFYHPPAAEDLLDEMTRLLDEAKVADVGDLIATLRSNRG
jgi:dihydroorotate dehydrogenase (NAD+) catalytic subunit